MKVTPQMIEALAALRSIVQVSRSGAAEHLKTLDRAGVFAEIDEANSAKRRGFDVDLAYKIYRLDGSESPARIKQFDCVNAPDEEAALLEAQRLLIDLLMKARLIGSATELTIISGVTFPVS